LISEGPTMNVHGSPWPFDDPPNVTTITTANVLDRNDPILLVTHDGDDGTWRVLCGKTNDPKYGRVVGLGELFDRDPSIGQLADLPLGWRAWRDSVGSPWQRGPNPTALE
jgi:hypothetical protein